MSTPKLTPVQELRDCIELLLRAVGVPYLALAYPQTLKHVRVVLKKTEHCE